MSRQPGERPDARISTNHAVRLRLAQAMQTDLERARALFQSPEAPWLGHLLPESPGADGVRRYETDLALPMRDRPTRMLLKKAAYVDLGAPVELGDSLQLQVSWRSANLAPLFPVFVGTLTLRPSALALDGYYAPPGGELGLILDRALLNIAARGTGRWFLSRVAEALQHAG